MLFHEIDISEKEKKYVLETLDSGEISGRGKHTKRVEKQVEKILSADKVLMTTSGTHALELAIRLCNIGPGDEVLMPSYTFPSTANAVLAVGAKPVFTQVDNQSLCISSKEIEKYINKKTKAVIAVHYGGICHDLDVLAQLCQKHKIKLIEDAAQAFGSKYKGKALGTYGDYGCLSFHGTKNDVAGEGGALVIPRVKPDNYIDVELAERMIEKGTDRIAFLRGDRNKYEWQGYGSSYVPSDLLMALLRGQLESFESRMEKRREIVSTYINTLSKYSNQGVKCFMGFNGEYQTDIQKNRNLEATAYSNQKLSSSVHETQSAGKSNGHVFYLIFETVSKAKLFKKIMDETQIPIRQHFVPLHVSKMGEKLGYSKDQFPYEKDIFERLYRLPVHSKLNKNDIEHIVQSVERAIQRCNL